MSYLLRFCSLSKTPLFSPAESVLTVLIFLTKDPAYSFCNGPHKLLASNRDLYFPLFSDL